METIKLSEVNCILTFQHYQAISILEDSEIGQIIRALFDDIDESKMTQNAKFALRFILPEINKKREHYIQISKVNSENGKRGGRPRKESEREKSEKKRSVFSESEKKRSLEERYINSLSTLNSSYIGGVGGSDSSPIASDVQAEFVPPSIEDVEAYCAEKGYSIDCGRYWDKRRSVGWKGIVNWQADIDAWNRIEWHDGKKQSSAVSDSESYLGGCEC